MLCEKGDIGGEQSSRNWGWCRKMGRDAREIPLALESLRLWRGDERAHRPRNRLPPARHRLSVRNRAGSREAGSLAGAGRQTVQLDTQAAARANR